MFHRFNFLVIDLVGLSACIAAIVCLIRARGYYVKPIGINVVQRCLARFYPSNYVTEGAVLARLGLLSSVLFAYSLMGPAIYFTRFGTWR